MPHFFIERPVFAWVVALFIVLAGLLSIPRLPVAQYPGGGTAGNHYFRQLPGGQPRHHEYVGGVINRARNLWRR